jgi:hypothetical protein
VNPKTTEELKNIITRDYNKSISGDQTEKLGMSLLRLTSIAVVALARADETFVCSSKREELSSSPGVDPCGTCK